MQEFLEELWSCIKDKEDDKQDSYFSMLGGVHLVLGIISTVVISIITPLHFWGFLTAFIAVTLFVIWCSAPKGKLSIGYFFAMSFFQFGMGNLPTTSFSRNNSMLTHYYIRI